MAFFVEQNNIVPIIMPIDLAAGANTGDWVSLKDYGKLVLIYCADVGTAGEDPVITINQATDVAGTSSKALTFETLHIKQGATALNAVGTFTKVTQSAAATYTNATGGENEELYVIEISAEMLDVDNAFDCVQVTIADPGTAGKLGFVLGLLCDARYPQATTPTGIAD